MRSPTRSTKRAAVPMAELQPLIVQLVAEIKRQDELYEGTAITQPRLALAEIEYKTAQALRAWREERDATRGAVMQIAAVALRALRDAL